MQRSILTFAALLVACASSTVRVEDASTSDARAAGDGGPVGYCPEAMFPGDLDRTCSTSSDCAIVLRQTDCCGGAVVLAIRASERARADAAQSRTDEACPARCECLARIHLEDGSDVANPARVAAVCDAARCTARISM